MEFFLSNELIEIVLLSIITVCITKTRVATETKRATWVAEI